MRLVLIGLVTVAAALAVCKRLAPKTSLSSKSAIAREACEAFGLVATSIALIALGNSASKAHAD